jgi:tRNA/rRNA methyltransferase
MTAAGLVVVLVEPAGPLNVGSVARLCANFGIESLRLVNPRCDYLGSEARLMAVHGANVLEQARCFANLEGALADCRRVVATSGRCDGEPLPLLPPEQALEWLLAPSPASPAPVALVFGREDRGLSNDELLQAGRLLTLGTAEAYRSLNLSHAVAVVLHTLQEVKTLAQARAHAATNLGVSITTCPSTTSESLEPCERQELEAMLTDAQALLLDVGFLYPHTSHARMAKVRQMLQRAQVSSADVALIRGMVRQLRWASAGRSSGQTP